MRLVTFGTVNVPPRSLAIMFEQDRASPLLGVRCADKLVKHRVLFNSKLGGDMACEPSCSGSNLAIARSMMRV